MDQSEADQAVVAAGDAPVRKPLRGIGAMALDDLPEFLTILEAAAVLRIGRTSAYQLSQRWRYTRGRVGLPVIRVGGQLRVPRAALVRLSELRGDAA